ncbi:SCO1860 family LAETG-anchored protein [Streptomyces sp. MNU89]|uniref:SCO1860 family LAETG-anchored protein n=1 Tax=Streptomyces sp. MNU89 TaxID=2560025 RepID=UPI001E5E3508|nr:SCO1860 family LAETG-anchored protein [Streptomyces sp. MNU89]MCC9742239.1 LPXTG cell wall anchor domain-containing protein [Streptomyces sp. MNU89]
MNSNAFVPPVRRTAAALTAAALAAAPVLLAGAAPAYASGGDGKAGAVVLRADLGVTLLDRTRVPLNVTLNEVQAPESARETLLTARVEGAHRGRPVEVLKAAVATADAKTEAGKAEGRANLVNARVYVPGLKHRPLIELDQVTSTAVCPAGKQPTAEAKIPGHVTVFGQRVELSAEGTARADVKGVGSVELALAKTTTTATTAAATALELQVSVTPELTAPKKLNVAAVEGKVTLVEATCVSPAGGSGDGGPGTGNGGATEGGTGGSGGGSGEGDGSGDGSGSGDGDGSGDGVSTQTGSGSGEDNLAATGGNSTTPYLAAGAGALLAAGGVSVFVARRRAAARRG